VAEGRINGSLNLSRALGDYDYKQAPALGPAGQMVTAVPDVRHLALAPGDEFALLACDGIWDVLSNQEARVSLTLAPPLLLLLSNPQISI
jgi:serine/threonine protein phosphatase PrpC